MMELAIKTMTAERRIGSQRAERETIRSLLWARMNDRVVRGEAISSLEPRSRSGMRGIDSRSGLPLRMREGRGALGSALHGLKCFGGVRAGLYRSAAPFSPP